jgi:hypothetical protein
MHGNMNIKYIIFITTSALHVSGLQAHLQERRNGICSFWDCSNLVVWCVLRISGCWEVSAGIYVSYAPDDGLASPKHVEHEV